MKILLLNAPPLKKFGVIGQMYPPLGILYLASYIRKYLKDIEIKVIDGYQESYNTLLRNVKKVDPDVLGVSFTTQASTGAYKIINEIKKDNKSIKIICGGAHTTALPEEVLKKSETDMIVMGEGEVTFLEILKSVKDKDQNRSILGTALWEDGRIKINPYRPLIRDLDTIPFPARDLLDIKKYPGYYYKKRRRDTSLISSRGCPFNCLFCSNPVWKHQKPWFRLRSPQNVVDEMEHIIKEFGVTEFFDETDEFNANRKWAEEVCDEITKRGMDISWKVQMRADNMDDQLAEKMAKAGCWLGLFGIESGNDETLKGINKKLTISKVKQSLGILKRHGIKAYALFMAFNAWEENGRLKFENKTDTLNTLDFAKELIKEKKIDLMSWSLTTPYPGSKLFDIALRHKLIPQEFAGRWELWDSSANLIMKLPGIGQRDWIEVQNKGKRIQIRLLLTSGTINIQAIPLYVRRGLAQLNKVIFSKLSFRRISTKVNLDQGK
ncbi:MAG TPA: B12-binding domain-containing radical SAM protein [Candidatus Scalindua sp.]|nr:B12-binding domain-containing radical SAM protein [Candidatus Scalindua sp.]